MPFLRSVLDRRGRVEKDRNRALFARTQLRRPRQQNRASLEEQKYKAVSECFFYMQIFLCLEKIRVPKPLLRYFEHCEKKDRSKKLFTRCKQFFLIFLQRSLCQMNGPIYKSRDIFFFFYFLLLLADPTRFLRRREGKC